MKGGHGDNYYYQLVANVRQFKGTAPLPVASAARSIAIDGGFDQWKDVQPEFSDDVGDTLPRDHDGRGGTHYVNRTGRNDLVAVKVAHDSQKSLLLRTNPRDLSASTDANWMWLLIDADRDASTGWQGYDFIVNGRSSATGRRGSRRMTVAGPGSGWPGSATDVPAMSCTFRPARVPRSSLRRLSCDLGRLQMGRQRPTPGDIMDFYVSGDVAPEGRFRFRYKGVTGRDGP